MSFAFWLRSRAISGRFLLKSGHSERSEESRLLPLPNVGEGWGEGESSFCHPRKNGYRLRPEAENEKRTG